MTVYISADARNPREEIASLRNQGGYEKQPFWYGGVPINGTFDTDDGWNLTSSWTISGGVASIDGSQTSIANSGSTTAYAVAGKTYLVTYTITAISSGSFKVFFGGVSGTSRTSAGTYTETFVAVNNNALVMSADTNFAGSIDNISIYETDGTNVIHSLPSGWKPKHVFSDGLLQREGSAHDYEVIYDGFNYYVKLVVAPSTETCVIGVRA